MTLMELLREDILANHIDCTIYSECEDIYKGYKPFLELDAKYANRKVLRITPRELEFKIFVSREEETK